MCEITVLLNGEKTQLSQKNSTLKSLLDALNIVPEHVVVEHNGNIIKGEWVGDERINANDRIEIVQFMGGGNANV